MYNACSAIFCFVVTKAHDIPACHKRLLNLNLVQKTVVPKCTKFWERETYFAACIIRLLCSLSDAYFGCQCFAMTLTMFVLDEGHYTNRYNPYSFMCEYGYKLDKVWSHLFPPEFLLNFNTAFHSMGPHHIHTIIPFSDCISDTSFSCHIHPGDGE